MARGNGPIAAAGRGVARRAAALVGRAARAARGAVVPLALAAASLGPHAVRAADGPGAADGVREPALAAALAPAGDGRVRFTVANEGEATVALLLRDTPLDRFLAHDVLEVVAPARDWPGVRHLPWTGPIAKRLPPGPDEVRVLAPGESVSALVPVGERYAVPEDGRYTVRWAGTLRVAPGDGETAAAARRAAVAATAPRSRTDTSGAAAEAAPVATEAFREVRPDAAAAELALRATPPAPLGPRVRPATYEGCSADERAAIDEAALIAEAWSVESRSGLEALAPAERPASPRYRLWFGEHEPARFERVVESFRAIEDAFANETISYECGCTEPGVFAYVNPFVAHDITLCPVFWATTAAGRDSRAGTLIHEISHFRTVAATDDHTYAQVPSQRLAASRPDLAVDNADSYGYFAENQPAVPIDPDGERPADDPAGGGAGPAFATLEPGVPVEGRLARGERARYRVDGAASLTLESLSGDADLFVHADAALVRRTCVSERVTPIDECPAVEGGTSWVEVLGYSAARYRLVAEPAAGEPAGSGEGIPLLGTLEVGDAVTGEVARSAIVAWRLADGGLVELRSTAGDADLYVHEVPADGGPLSESTLVCRSFGDSGQGDVTERCRVAPGEPHYLLVAGFDDAEYALSIGAADTAAGRPGDAFAVGDGTVMTPAGGADDHGSLGTVVAGEGTGAVGEAVVGDGIADDGIADDGAAGGAAGDGGSGGGSGGPLAGLALAAALLARRRRAQSRAIVTP